MGWQGYDNEGCMPGDRELIARGKKRMDDSPIDPVVAERKRLEREVIEAAKADLAAERREEGDDGIDRLIAARRRYRAAVIALIEFETAHQWWCGGKEPCACTEQWKANHGNK